MEQELYHHGVKGMKWGVRRFQRKDGTLTSAGKKRYDDSGDKKSAPKEKSKRQQNLEAYYRDKKLPKAEAERLAAKRVRAEKIALAAAGMTVAACAAYYGNKAIKRRVDSVVKAGESLQRIEMKNTEGKLHDVFYAAGGKHDKQRYFNLLGATRQKQTGEAFVMKLSVNKDIKVASQKRAQDTFKKLYENDTEFRSAVKKYAAPLADNSLSGSKAKSVYEQFNRALVEPALKESGADKKFYDQLKSAGYGAIQDINDMKYSGYKAKNPLIFFDNASGNITTESFKKIEQNLKESGQKELIKAYTEDLVESLIPHMAIGATGVAASAYASSYFEGADKDVERYRNSRRYS